MPANTRLIDLNMDTAAATNEQIIPVDQKSFTEKVVLSVRNLHKAFGGQIVLNDISLDLHQGEIVLLRGENGSGKTTLLNILTGNLEPDEGEIQIAINGTREAFKFPRPWWKELNPFDHFTPERLTWEGVGRVWQDIRLFPTMKTIDNIAIASANGIGENPLAAFLPKTYRVDNENKKTASKWLDMLGLGDRNGASCDKISLGQMKRVAIARAIQAGAKILFLDEPLSGLDGTGIISVVNYLKMLVKDHAITIVIVEHSFNIPKLVNLVNTVWSLSKESENQEGYKLSVSESSEISLARDKERNTLQNLLEELAGNKGKITEEKLPGGAKIKTVQTLSDDNCILEIKNLKVKRGIISVFGNAETSKSGGLSLTLKKGQISILEAPNGWGKSSLLDAIAGLRNGSLKISDGNIYLKGNNITNAETYQIARLGLSYLRANQQAFTSLTVKEQMKLAHLSNHAFDGYLNKDRKGNSLSGGEKQKLLVDLMQDANVYILDEPMIGLDSNSIEIMKKYIIKKAYSGKTILITVPYTAN